MKLTICLILLLGAVTVSFGQSAHSLQLNAALNPPTLITGAVGGGTYSFPPGGGTILVLQPGPPISDAWLRGGQFILPGPNTSNTIGTLDAASFDIITNGNNVRLSIDPAGLVSIGSTGQFQVTNSGDLSRVNDIPYSWPNAQGAAFSLLTNDGSGALTWQTLSGVTVTDIAGTANQVLVNGTSGVATTGSVILTTPQDIGTTSTPAFGGITINGTSDLVGTVNVTGDIIPAATASYDLGSDANRWRSIYVDGASVHIGTGPATEMMLGYAAGVGSINIDGGAPNEISISAVSTTLENNLIVGATNGLQVTSATGEISRIGVGSILIGDNIDVQANTIANIGSSSAGFTAAGQLQATAGIDLTTTQNNLLTDIVMTSGATGGVLETRTIASLAGLIPVNTDATLTGDGTTGTPLGFNLSNSNTWLNDQLLPASDAQGSNLIASVNSSAAGLIDAARIGNGLTDGQVNNDLTIDGGTVNNSPITNSSISGSTGSFTTITGTALPSGSTATDLVTSNGGALETRTIASLGGSIAVATDGTLIGDGTTGTPLGFNLSNSNTWLNDQLLPASDAQGSNLIASVNSSAAGLIDAARIGNGLTDGQVNNDLTIDGGTVNNSPITNSSISGSTGSFTTITGTALPSGSTATDLVTSNGGALETRTIASLGGSIAVATDGTLIGDGTTGTPLGFNLSNSNTWLNDQLLPASDAQGSNLIASVNSSAAGLIDAARIGNGLTDGQVNNDLTIDGGTVNNSPITNSSISGSTGSFTTITGTALPSGSTATDLVTSNGGALETRTINSLGLATGVEPIITFSADLGSLSDNRVLASTDGSLTLTIGALDDGDADVTINTAHSNSWGADQLLPASDAQGSNLIASVNSSAAGLIDAARIGNGLTDGQVNNDLTIDGGTVNNSPITNSSISGSTGSFTTITGTALPSGSTATDLVTSNGGALETRTIASLGGSIAVATDGTLIGDGTTGTPLGFNLSNSNTWLNDQLLPASDAQGSNLIASVNSSAAGLIDAARIGNGLTDGQVNNDLTIDGGTVNNSPITNSSISGSTGSFTTITGTALPSGSTATEVVVSNAGVLETRTLDASAVTTLSGTADQILVNGTSGTPTSGIITLTTPQDIGTTSSPTFGGITVNGTSNLQDAVPQSDNTYSLGTDDARWADAFINGSSLHVGPTGGAAGNTELRLGYVANSGSINIDGGADELTIGVNGSTANGGAVLAIDNTISADLSGNSVYNGRFISTYTGSSLNSGSLSGTIDGLYSSSSSSDGDYQVQAGYFEANSTTGFGGGLTHAVGAVGAANSGATTAVPADRILGLNGALNFLGAGVNMSGIGVTGWTNSGSTLGKMAGGYFYGSDGATNFGLIAQVDASPYSAFIGGASDIFNDAQFAGRNIALAVHDNVGGANDRAIYSNGQVELVGLAADVSSPNYLAIDPVTGIVSSLAFPAAMPEAWTLGGNTAPSSTIFGTLSPDAIDIRTNNVPRILIDGTTGYLGIGDGATLDPTRGVNITRNVAPDGTTTVEDAQHSTFTVSPAADATGAGFNAVRSELIIDNSSNDISDGIAAGSADVASGTRSSATTTASFSGDIGVLASSTNFTNHNGSGAINSLVGQGNLVNNLGNGQVQIGIGAFSQVIQSGSDVMSQAIGVHARVQSSGSVTSGVIADAVGSASEVQLANDATMNSATGLSSSIENADVGTISTAIGVNVNATNTNGTIDNLTMVSINTPGNGAGNISTVTGLYIGEQNVGGSNTALLYDHSSSPVIITGDGKVGVGTTTVDANAALTVNGGATISSGVVVFSTGSVSAGATITIPDGVTVVRITDDAATTANAITMPAGVEGQSLYIYNNDADASTGTVIAPNTTSHYIYIGGGWQHIQ